jgi:C4-dicarboxylate-binding protein DctP
MIRRVKTRRSAGTRTAVIAVCVLCLATSLAFAGGGGEAAAGAPAGPIVCRIAHSGTEKIPRHIGFLKFKEIVEEKTKGAIKVEIYPQSQLGTEAQITEQVQLGTVQATITGSFEQITPKLLIYTMPFLFDKIDGLYKVTRGRIGEEIVKGAEKNNFIVLATGDAGGFRHISNNVRPITKPADMKGLKIRTPPIESIIKTMEALGASPVSIAYGEVYLALKTGVADGQENPLVNIANMKFHEVQKYLTVISYQWHPAPFTFSLKWYNALSREHQKIVKDAAEEAMIVNDSLIQSSDEESFNLIKSQMQVNVLTQEQRKLFIDAAKPVYDYYINKGLFTMEELKQIRKVAGS